jgi:hypothetical protein
MAASFPGAIKSFSAVVNGVTKLVAALFNSPYDEITAIETELGTDPAGSVADLKTRLAVSMNDGGTIKALTTAIPTKIYDSGWFAVALDGTYTKAHGLATAKVLKTVYFSDSSDGSGVVLLEQQAINSIGLECAITDLDSTNVVLQAGHNLIAQKDVGGSATTYTSGYAKILLLALD